MKNVLRSVNQETYVPASNGKRKKARAVTPILKREEQHIHQNIKESSHKKERRDKTIIANK
jgi:hypothetical protein